MVPSIGEMMDDLQRNDRLRAAGSTSSRVRENLIEHVFISEILQEAWFAREQPLEVLRAEVDAFGYDLVLDCNGVLRHVQLKASERDSRTRKQTVNTALVQKTGACVIWIVFWREEDYFENKRLELFYRFFGGRGPRDPMPSLGEVVGSNTRSKTLRPNTRVLNLNQFEHISSTATLLDRLFGPIPTA